MPNTVEIVSNNESTRCRKLVLKGRTFILRKSICKIDRNNLYAYIILQLFTDMDFDEDFTEELKEKIKQYMEKTNVQKKDLMMLLKYFPAKTSKNLMNSGVFSEFIK